MDDELLTIPEAARFLKISKSKVYQMAKEGKLPHFKIGRNIRIRKEDLKEWLKDYHVPAMEEPSVALREVIRRMNEKSRKNATPNPLQPSFKDFE